MNTQNKKKHISFITALSGLILIVLICLIIYISFEYYDLFSLQKQYAPDLSGTSYQHHCAFITDNYEDAFWDSVYEGARSQGAECGIYVENFGKDLYLTYTTEELMEMAISANVDAIIVEPEGSITSLINEATEKGIAVSTIYKDDMNSSRYSFTGVNNFRMGYEYGELALKYSPSDADSIMVLLDNGESSAEQRLLISGIGRAIQEKDRDIAIETMILDSNSTFDVEEQVRNFMKNSHGITDTIICTDLVQTQSVSQTAIDLNFVGDFTIIGSYESYSVLEALKNGVISANIVVDTQQMGKSAVTSLQEYLTFGHSSDYTSVNTTTIGRQNAIQRLAAMDTLETGGSADET